MAVNTWELALASETDRSSRTPNHDGKLAFVIPRSVSDYLGVLMRTGVVDPAEFQWPTDKGSEPELGPQNSFAARWIYLYAPERFAASGRVGNPGTVIPIYPYDDSRHWDLGTPEGDRLLAEICNWVYTHLPD